MNALQMSREYVINTARPSLERNFNELGTHLASGLVGNGSECFGFDDILSRDHDWGVDFYIWTLEDDRDHIPALNKWKNELLESDPPEYPRSASEYGARIGCMTCGDFYRSLIGTPQCPQTLEEWIKAPEEQFAMAVNGEVFFDAAGEFSGTREELLRYYPEDIRLKRIAAKCMAVAQTGQYNHDRTYKRGDFVTLRTVLSRFTDNAIALVFLLNKTYKPYYKWAFRALGDLPLLGRTTADALLQIAENGDFDGDAHEKRKVLIEELCKSFADELTWQGLSDSNDYFLASHGESVQKKIKSGALSALPPQYEI